MRSYVTFETTRFPVVASPTEGGDIACLGQDCALWLAACLAQQGYSPITPDDLIEEDWGCLFQLPTAGFVFVVFVALDTADPTTWLAGIESSDAHATYPTFMRWLGRSDNRERLELCLAVNRTLVSCPDVKAIRWYYGPPGVLAKREAGADSPTAP